MAFDFDHPDPDTELQLSAFADMLADGTPVSPDDDITATLLYTHDILGPNARGASALPESAKHAIWEKLMNSTTADIMSIALLKRTSPQSPLVPPVLRGTVSRWHAAISLAAVIAFLIGIIGIAYLRGPHQDPNQTPASLLGQVMYDGDDASTYIQTPAECTTNGGSFTTDEELVTRSITDWPDPVYTPAQAVAPEVGDAILQTYLGFVRCNFEAQNAMNWNPATPVTYQDVFSPTAISYLSDRYRFGAFLYSVLPAEQQAAVDAFYCRPRVDAILDGFPLPVNQPEDFAVLERTVDNIPTYTPIVFAASDVYRLPDGRFGAITGTISAVDLTKRLDGIDDAAGATAVDASSSLLFVSFVERDEAYYIDEEFIVSATDEGSPLHRRDAQCANAAG